MKIKALTDYDKRRAEHYKDLLNKLESVSMESTLQQLQDALGIDLVIVIGDNESGVDVVNLDDESFVEWTW